MNLRSDGLTKQDKCKKITAIIQARLQSTRLPGKVMYELGGQSVLKLILQRLQRCRQVHEIIVATGDCPQNQPILDVAARHGIRSFVGSEDDVLKRFVLAAQYAESEVIVRVTADCPLVDPELIDEMVATFLSGNYDYVTNVRPPTWPDGLDISVFSRSILERADREAVKFFERQHVVPWMWEAVFGSKATGLTGLNVRAPEDLSRHRWVLDAPCDYAFFLELTRHIEPHKMITIGWRNILSILREHPEICALNNMVIRDEGLIKDMLKD